MEPQEEQVEEVKMRRFRVKTTDGRIFFIRGFWFTVSEHNLLQIYLTTAKDVCAFAAAPGQWMWIFDVTGKD